MPPGSFASWTLTVVRLLGSRLTVLVVGVAWPVM
jgi:hypothetical protein